MKSYGKDPSTNFEIFATSVASLAEVRGSLDFPQAYFALLLACDASSLSEGELKRTASELIDRGLVYLCAWGPGCERVHDLFDLACAERKGLPEDFVLMTTWHEDQSLDEALWFLLNCAMPIDDYWDDHATVALSVGDEAWAQQIDRRLSNREAFNKEMVG